MDIEKVSDLYSNQMRIPKITKLAQAPQQITDQKKRNSQSSFGATEVLAEKLLLLEKRVEELERKVGL